MGEEVEADPLEQPLNGSRDLRSGGEPVIGTSLPRNRLERDAEMQPFGDAPANCNFREAAVSEGRAVFIAIVGVLVVITIVLAAALGGQLGEELGLEPTLPWLRRAISRNWLQVDQSPAPTAASLQGEMQEGAEADFPEQPLNNSIDLKSGGERDAPANCNFREAAVSKGRAVFVAIVGVLVVIIIALAAALGVEKSKHSSQCPSAASRCPDGWIRIKGKFYYFSNAPGNWTYSQSFCSSHAASLAGIDNLQELGSLLPYKGKLDHWIGLRKATGQVWKWANGTEFDHRFEIHGGAECAYLDEDLTVSSSSCSTLRKQICSRPDAPT